MRKLMFISVLILLVGGNLYSQFAVDSTRSMNEEHISAIRTDFNGGDNIATYYWDWFIFNNPTLKDSLMSDEIERERDDFNASIKNLNAWGGELGFGMEYFFFPFIVRRF